MLRYALYARKSKDDKSGLIKSIEDQKTAWKELAEQQGLVIKAIFEENKTAKIPGVRPVYRTLIEAVRMGEVDGILVWHINRLARNMEEAGSLAQMLIDGKLKEIRTPHWTYRPGDNVLPLLLEQGMSTQYSLDLAEAVKRGMNSMVADGGWPHRAKVGYLNDRDALNSKKGIITKDPERFDLMRKAFELLLANRYSLRRVVDILNDAWGFRTKPTPMRPGGKLSYAAAYDIFTNAFYAGYTIHEGVQRKGRHEPMISVSEFNRLQEILQAKRHGRRRTRTFCYTGLLRCGNCGMQVTAEQHEKKGKLYVYYRCSDPYGKCSKRGINEKVLETELLSHLESVTIDPQWCEIALENVARWQGQEQISLATIGQQQEQTLADIEKQRSNLLEMMLKGLLTDEAMYKEKEAALLNERNRLQLEVEQAKDGRKQMLSNAQASVKFMQKAHEHFMVANFERRQAILRTLASEFLLSQNELRVTIDPLLEGMVRYTQEIKAQFEPPEIGSGSGKQALILSKSCVGGSPSTLIELPESLVIALQERLLTDLFV